MASTVSNNPSRLRQGIALMTVAMLTIPLVDGMASRASVILALS
jgi:hypothetical protein